MGNGVPASFPLLIDQLIRERHGSGIALGRDAEIGNSTIFRWRHGDMDHITPLSISKLCASQGLSEDRVWALIRHGQDLKRKGKTIPLPDLTDLRPGPLTNKERHVFAFRRRLRSKVMGALAGLAVIIGAAGAAATPPQDVNTSADGGTQTIRGIMSRWWWCWWGGVADRYLTQAWRAGLTTFRVWPAVPNPFVYGGG